MEKDVVKFIKKQNIAIMGNKTWMAVGGILCFGKWGSVRHNANSVY